MARYGGGVFSEVRFLDPACVFKLASMPLLQIFIASAAENIGSPFPWDYGEKMPLCLAFLNIFFQSQVTVEIFVFAPVKYSSFCVPSFV